MIKNIKIWGKKLIKDINEVVVRNGVLFCIIGTIMCGLVCGLLVMVIAMLILQIIIQN
jgi:tetrahydromethanopterin S-methyltransferase subunit F